MNLIQVQEHLKDMPMRNVLEYANGKSAQVPPYLALGELNRRKQMEQSAKTPQAPDGTVKERLEKELTGQATDLMQANSARQAQSNEAMQQGIMAQPQPVPEGTPQPPQLEEEMPQMAGGGLTALPVKDMFKFAEGGGIVAFSNGDVVVDQAEQAARDAKVALRQYGLRQQQQDPQGFAAAQQASAAADSALNDARRAAFSTESGPAGAMGRTMGAPVRDPQQQAAARVQPDMSAENQSAAETARLLRQNAGPPMGLASVAQPAVPPMPSMAVPGGISSAMPKPPTMTAPDPDAYDKKLAAFKQANPGLAGSEFQALIEKLSKQDEADRARFASQEKARSQSDFFRSLIDAGEATRGQKGIGALFAGFGRSSGAAQAAADERENAQRKMRREQDLGMAKIRAELEAARRAEARGDFESAFKHRQDAEKIGMELQQKEFSNQMDIAKLKEQARGNSIQAATANRAPQVIQVAQEIMRQNPKMTFNEASDRAAALVAGGQYQSAAQRQQKAIMDAMNEQTKNIDMQLSYQKPGTPEEKALIAQRDAVIKRFMESQKLLASGQTAAPTQIPGKVEREK
jgi:hypothetical protein